MRCTVNAQSDAHGVEPPCTRRIASPMVAAHAEFLHPDLHGRRSSTLRGIVLVTYTPDSTDSLMRDVRGAVEQPMGRERRDTRRAPLSLSAFAAPHSVPAVSIMSSTMKQSQTVDLADDVHHLGHVRLGPTLVEDRPGRPRAACRSGVHARDHPASGETTTPRSPTLPPAASSIASAQDRSTRTGGRTGR